MTDDRRPIGEDDITAFVDDRLPPGRLAAFERALQSDAGLRARVFADRALQETLRAQLAPIAAQPIPPRLRIAALLDHRRARVRERVRQALGIAAGCVLLLGCGMAAGWQMRGATQGAAGLVATAVETADAIAAHRVFVVETAHPVEVAAAQQAHLVQWLSRRVGHTLRTPDLSAQGYQLMGGRVLPAGDEAAAQFMYEDGLGHRLTLYVKASAARETGFSFVAQAPFNAFSWAEDGLGFAIIGPIDRAGMLALATAAYRQLDPHMPAPVSH